MRELMLKLVKWLTVNVTPDGKLPKPPHKKGSKGFFVHQPKPYQLDTLISLAGTVGWNVIPSRDANGNPDGKTVYVGPADSFSFENEDECMDYAMDFIEG